METRQKKQLIISIAYLILLVAVVVGFYEWLKPGANCFDKIKNQNEEGLDCGGICAKKCAPISHITPKIKEVGFLPSGSSDQYDIYAQVENPNQTLGIKKISYTFSLKDANGETLAKSNGSAFFLPGETKYIIINNIYSASTPQSAEMEFGSEINWVEATDQYSKPDIQVVNREYQEISSGIGFAQASALVKNNSQLDLNEIAIAVIMRDVEGKVIAINGTRMNSVLAGESREFTVNWPNRFAGVVYGPMEVQAESNIFSDDAFMQKSFKTEKFQDYQ